LTLRRWLTILFLAIFAIVGLGGYTVWHFGFREVPDAPADIETVFKYGSIGAEGTSIPTAIWRALPELCSDLLPGGYASLGFIYAPGADRPIGVTERTVGVPRAAFNCATCHAGTVRTSPEAEPSILLGMPAHQMDVQGYTRFVTACIDSDRFTADLAMPIIERDTPMSAIEAAFFRYAIIPGTKREVAAVRERFTWFDSRPDFGPGRFDDINPNKADMSQDDTIGTADLVPVWNLAAHEGHARHWDGNATTLRESLLNSVLAAGTPADKLDIGLVERIEDYLKAMPPPAFPFDIDNDLAARGESIFEAECASCHGPDSDQVGRVTPATVVGTDPHRAASYTPAAAAETNAQSVGYPWEFNGYHSSDGYVNVLLDGLWARAPYLHNGSVPTLSDLLSPPEQRPAVFYRGYDVIDAERVGFVSDGPEASRDGFRFDTALPGNSNSGHLFGTTLGADEKRALIEFLKTR
jgi:mono/diheme cytochrome c family protein